MEYQHGCYTAQWEGTLLHLRHTGDASVDDVIWLSDLVVTQAAKVGPIDIIADLSRLGHVSPVVRKQFSQHPVHQHIKAIASFGASLTLRAVVILALRASFLFSKAPVEVAFFSNESEARAWMQRQRAKRP